MKVLAVGPSGTFAGKVTRDLADQGVEVRGLVHSEKDRQGARDNGATEVVVADLNDQGALEKALDGMDGVFHLIPAFVPDEAATGLVMVEAAKKVGVDRFVFSGVYHPSLELSNHRDKRPVERALYDSELPFVIFQPGGMFMDQLGGLADQAEKSGVISGPYSAASKMSYVDFADVASAVTKAFTTDDLLYGTFEVSSAGMYSRADIAGLLGELLGKDVRAEGGKPDLPGSMPSSMREGLTKMMEHYDRVGLHGGNALVLRAILGREPTTVKEYLTRVVRG